MSERSVDAVPFAFATTLLAGLLLAPVPFLLTAIGWPMTPIVFVLPGALFGPVSLYLVALLPPLLLWSWMPRLFLGLRDVPIRSVLGLGGLVAMQAAWFMLSPAPPSARAFVALSSLVPPAFLWMLALVADRRRSFVLNLAFHAGVVLWLCTVGFPDSGRWP